jgi:hypothetical protein
VSFVAVTQGYKVAGNDAAASKFSEETGIKTCKWDVRS